MSALSILSMATSHARDEYPVQFQRNAQLHEALNLVDRLVSDETDRQARRAVASRTALYQILQHPAWDLARGLFEISDQLDALWFEMGERILSKKILVVGSDWVVRPNRWAETLEMPTWGTLRNVFGGDIGFFRHPMAIESDFGTIAQHNVNIM